jgi:uncharacterized membrane protein
VCDCSHPVHLGWSYLVREGVLGIREAGMLRTPKERIVQSLSYELGGLLLATPIYAVMFGSGGGSSLLLMVTLSIAMLTWSPVHNTVFDWLDYRFTQRLASERPHGLRICHAASHELTSVIVTLPLIMLVGGHGFIEGLAVDIGLSLFYTAYAYLFHIAFDWWRPMVPQD